MCKTYKDFPEFYENEFIRSIKDTEKWTVSDNEKMPIDMKTWIYEHRICGAFVGEDYNPFMTLDDLCHHLPNAKNHAFLLDAISDKFVILDIEPTCPDAIKQELLKTPYIYGEISMSGKGYHLAFPLPDCIKNYPIAQNKIVMKEKHGYYEILMSHYVTFTRNMIPLSENPDENGFIRLFEKMAAEQKESQKTEFDVSEEYPLDKIPFVNDILDILYKQKYRKTPEDFDDDHSKYEYGHIGFLHSKLKLLQNVSYIKEAHTYSDEEKAIILYTVAKEELPYRPKHDEFRDGLPWLLYLCREVIAKSDNKKS